MKKALFSAWALAGLLLLPMPVLSAETFTAGQAVEVEWQGSWYPAVIVEQQAKHRADDGSAAPYLIHYEGYDSGSDEWVGPSRIRVSKPTPAWVDGPYPVPPAGEDYHSFVVAKAGKQLVFVDSGGAVWMDGKKVANFDITWGYLYRSGQELGWIDTKGQIRLAGKIVARWDWGGAGLFYGKSETPRLVNSYGILYRDGEAWGTVMGPDETSLGEDGAFALLMVCLVPEFVP